MVDVSRSRTAAQYKNWGDVSFLSLHHTSNSTGGDQLITGCISAVPVISMSLEYYNVDAVTWWALRVRVMCAARRNESAVPAVAISALTSACVHPLPYNQSPRIFRAAISMCKPPNNTTSLSSPCDSSTGSALLEQIVVGRMSELVFGLG